MNIILLAVAVILATIGLVWLIDKFVPSKLKPLLNILLWVGIFALGYSTFNSVYEPIKFNKVKEKRYAKVIDKLIDIRDAQLAHRQVTGSFAGDFNSLIKFIDTAKFTITERKDSTVLDEDATRRYGGVETFKDITVIDTLGFVPVKDSLFKGKDNYKSMMNVPGTDSKFIMKASVLEDDDLKIPVFEAKVDKAVILADQSKDLITQEEEVMSVEEVRGKAIKVGSLEEAITGGNWPKTYGDNE